MTPGSQFEDDPMMKDDKLLTNANYGSVKRVCLIAMGDDIKELHRYLITLSPGTEVEEIAGADHAIMCSKPRELCDLLAKISSKMEGSNDRRRRRRAGGEAAAIEPEGKGRWWFGGLLF
uniref:AB hydrolase-1 domain-containing protein n=1 Tax=Oryza punctata TaxID=4537 RepID=A0A0E0JTE2_ORYPU